MNAFRDEVSSSLTFNNVLNTTFCSLQHQHEYQSIKGEEDIKFKQHMWEHLCNWLTANIVSGMHNCRVQESEKVVKSSEYVTIWKYIYTVSKWLQVLVIENKHRQLNKRNSWSPAEITFNHYDYYFECLTVAGGCYSVGNERQFEPT